MPKQNPLSIPNKSLHQDRNGFSRGFDSKLTTSCGIATPCFSEPVLGKSKVRINRESAFRSAQVNTAAFQEFDQFIDFYFVPFRQLFSYYGQMRTGIKDQHSSWMADNIPTSFPTLSFEDIYAAYNPSNPLDMFGYHSRENCFRLLDLLNYGHYDSLIADGTDCYSPQKFVPWYLLAYQKIWYDHYRNTNYITNRVSAYNVDKKVIATGGYSSFTQSEIQAMTELHYIPYRKDYFMSIYPSLNYSSNIASGQQPGSSYYHVPSSVITQVLGGTYGSEMSPDSRTVQLSDPSDPSNNYNALAYLGSSDGATVLSVQSIRAAFALDKLTRLVAYAPKHVADQFEVRFGFRPYAEDLNESKRIGSFKAQMSITEVLSTADTNSDGNGASLGALGGRGLLSIPFQRDIEFEVPEDGVIMGILYFLPRMSYDAGGIDSFSTIIDPVDLPDPIYMNLGLEPVYQKELYNFHFWYPSGSHDTTLEGKYLRLNNMVLGFQERYKRFKCGISRNHGDFVRNSALSDFTIHTREDRSVIPVSGIDALFDGTGVTASFFYCSPSDANSIFASDYDPSSDQFFGVIRFKFDVVQNLSVHGQPNI